MDRRHALTALGTAAAAAVTGRAAAGHDGKPAANPMTGFHAYLCAYHLGKANPDVVIESHHYCAPVRDEVHQCVIFDRNGPGARILGVEYIISDAIYRSLPDSEKKYYHPHTYEVTAGLLIAPNLTPDEEHKFMEGLVTTWGKTWHTWPDPNTPLPMGEPLLMWAATKDGQIDPKLLEERDRQFRVDTAALRRRRKVIGPVPQIDAPKSIDAVGRQWTNAGPDVPNRD